MLTLTITISARVLADRLVLLSVKHIWQSLASLVLLLVTRRLLEIKLDRQWLVSKN